MAWPTDAVATGELITAAQLNGLPVMLANTTLGADAASIDFQNIPGHYAHLMVVSYLRASAAVGYTGANIRFNNDSGSNYDFQTVQGNGATASAAETFGATSAEMGVMCGSSGGANLYAAMVMVVPHYANSSNNKSAVAQSSAKTGTGASGMASRCNALFWRSNSAITRLTIINASGDIESGSRATLYGFA